jgi:hypothetical protein
LSFKQGTGGEPVGQPLILVTVEIADQRPETVRQGLARVCPCPAVSTSGLSAARREIFAGKQPAERATGSAESRHL